MFIIRTRRLCRGR